MAEKFWEVMFTPRVREAQRHYYGRGQSAPPAQGDDALGAEEAEFIASRDSFYLSSVSETGWPYVQHRGGPVGFLKVLAPDELAFADYQGNRQMLTTGNVAGDDRVCLFLMDYPQRVRLKILGHSTVFDAREHPELAERVADASMRRVTERVMRIRVVSFDWNCPKYITPRYTVAEMEEVVGALKERIRELEGRLKGMGS